MSGRATGVTIEVIDTWNAEDGVRHWYRALLGGHVIWSVETHDVWRSDSEAQEHAEELFAAALARALESGAIT